MKPVPWSRGASEHQRLLLLSAEGCWRRPRGRTRRDTSSGWAPTAGAPKSPQSCTWRRWPRAPSPSCPSGSLSKVSGCARWVPSAPRWVSRPPDSIPLTAVKDSMFCSGSSLSGFSSLRLCLSGSLDTNPLQSYVSLDPIARKTLLPLCLGSFGPC